MSKIQQKRGADGEAALTASLKDSGLWSYKLPNIGYGTPFDRVIVTAGHAIEVKVTKNGRVPYSKISENERKGLTRFQYLVGDEKTVAWILGIWKNKGKELAFMVPWYQVAEDVCSGKRGSVDLVKCGKMLSKRMRGGGWDVAGFLRGVRADG